MGGAGVELRVTRPRHDGIKDAVPVLPFEDEELVRTVGMKELQGHRLQAKEPLVHLSNLTVRPLPALIRHAVRLAVGEGLLLPFIPN